MNRIQNPGDSFVSSTFIPADSSWDVKISRIGLVVRGRGLGDGAEASYKFKMEPKGSPMGLTSDISNGRFEASDIHPFPISETFLLYELGGLAVNSGRLFGLPQITRIYTLIEVQI